MCRIIKKLKILNQHLKALWRHGMKINNRITNCVFWTDERQSPFSFYDFLVKILLLHVLVRHILHNYSVDCRFFCTFTFTETPKVIKIKISWHFGPFHQNTLSYLRVRNKFKIRVLKGLLREMRCDIVKGSAFVPSTIPRQHSERTQWSLVI